MKNNLKTLLIIIAQQFRIVWKRIIYRLLDAIASSAHNGGQLLFH